MEKKCTHSWEEKDLTD